MPDTFVTILVLHFVADFVLQSDWQALNKSKLASALLTHTGLYALCFLPFYGLNFALVKYSTHTVTDYITSQVTARLWFLKPVGRKRIIAEAYPEQQAYMVIPNKRHWFFVAIGADQLIHYLTLWYTYQWFVV